MKMVGCLSAVLGVLGVLGIQSLLVALAAVVVEVPVEVRVEVDLAAAAATPFPHYWKTTFGSGHARLSLRDDWQAHLKKVSAPSSPFNV